MLLIAGLKITETRAQATGYPGTQGAGTAHEWSFVNTQHLNPDNFNSACFCISLDDQALARSMAEGLGDPALLATDVGPVIDLDVAANAVSENAANGTLVGVVTSASDADSTNNTIRKITPAGMVSTRATAVTGCNDVITTPNSLAMTAAADGTLFYTAMSGNIIKFLIVLFMLFVFDCGAKHLRSTTNRFQGNGFCLHPGC